MKHVICVISVLMLLPEWIGDFTAKADQGGVEDLSLLVAKDLPCVWPLGMAPVALIPTQTFGLSAFHRDMLLIDEHTGTQWDAPAHFVPPANSGLPGAGPMGTVTGEKVPAWQFCGEACVVDIRQHRDQAVEGASFLVEPRHVQVWEKENRALRSGDVVVFRSDYSDAYYAPFPKGDRFIAMPLRQASPGWPAPTPETMRYLAERGVMTLAIDSPSMGPLPDLAAATHLAGGQRGMIWVECATNLGALPSTGAFVAILAAKHAGGSGGECRFLAVTEPALTTKLIESAREKRVVDLSVTLQEDLPVTWPGYRAGEEASRYTAKTLNAFGRSRGPFFAMTHMLDTQAGTHVVLPSFSLPPTQFKVDQYSPGVRSLVDEYERRHGRLGNSDTFLEDVPLKSMMGPAHVIDVRKLRNSLKKPDWPGSPQITPELLKEHEKHRPIVPGEIVVFYSGYTDDRFQELPAAPELEPLFAGPLAGKAEGWPAVTTAAVSYLADKGVQCIAADSPTLGGVDPEKAAMFYWRAASKKMLLIEFLTNVDELADRNAYFIFAPVKVRGARSGYGRALALY